MCHHNINSGTRISLIGNYLQGGVCISISAVVELAQGGSATNGATPSSLLQIVTHKCFKVFFLPITDNVTYRLNQPRGQII